MRHEYFEESKPSDDLHRRSLRGGAVSMIAQGGNVLLQIGSTIVLARILIPEDFGLVAMVAAMTGFASIFIDLGTRDAVAQRGHISEGEASALFWITFGVGLAFTIIIALCAPLFARFYGEPRLVSIAIVMSLTFVLPGLFFQQYALMRRALMFRKLAIIDLSGNLLATICSIALAYSGFDYWALVWKPVLAALFIGTGVWISCGWLPGRPTFTRTVKELLGFGLNVTGFTVTDYVARSVDRVALGYTVGPTQLGYYQNAFTVYDNALNTCSLHNVATATLSKLRSDGETLKRAWSTAISSLAYFAAPAFAILAVVGHDLVVVLLGRKWEAAGAILSVLALRGPAHVVERTLGWLHVTAGRPERWRHWGVFNCAATVVALLCGLPFGAIGVAAAYAVLTTLLSVPAIVYAGKPLGIGIGDVLRAVGRQIGVALGIAAFGFAVRFSLLEHTAPLARLFILSGLCGGVYLAIMTLGFRMTKPLSVAASLVRRRTPKVG